MISISSSHKKTGLCVKGEGMLLVCDIEEWLDLPWFAEPKSVYVELAEGVTEVEKGLFALIPNIGEIETSKSVKDLGLDEQTVKHLRENDVLLRGEFDSIAEKAAKEHRLAFVHSDIELARAGDYSSREGVDIVTLKFDYDSKPVLQLSNFCQGSSAGSSGGGDEYKFLQKDFYRTMSQKDIAEMCYKRLQHGVMHNSALHRFLEKAKKKKGWFF